MKRLFSLVAVLALGLAACSERPGVLITDPVIVPAASHTGVPTSTHAVGVQVSGTTASVIWHKDPINTTQGYVVEVFQGATCDGTNLVPGGGNTDGTAWASAVNHYYIDVGPLAAGSYCAHVKSKAGSGPPVGFRAFQEATFEIQGLNQPPLAGFTYTPADPDEGENVHFEGTASDPDGDPLTYEWKIDGSVVSNSLEFYHVFDDNGSYTVTFKADDGNGGSASETQYIDVANVAPTATFNAPTAVDEGSPIGLSLTGVYDPSSADNTAGFEYAFDCGDGAGYGAYSSDNSASCPTADNGVRAVGGKVRDKDGGETEYTASVTVKNVAPTITSLNVSSFGPLPVTAVIDVSGGFTDPGTGDTHTLTLTCGGGVSSGETAAFTTAPAGSYSGTCTYASAGVYQITVTITDDDGGADSRTSDYIVVYDPSAGFVTGGGWIMSPAGACQLTAACGGLTGKANFGFVSKYLKGATVPTGNTEFQFHAGNLNFKSVAYQWLVVAGAKAQYKGTGTINGAGNYGFILTAIDGQLNGGGGIDKLRIKIWDKDNGDFVVYDNQMNADEYGDAATDISGGSIVIHTGKK